MSEQINVLPTTEIVGPQGRMTINTTELDSYLSREGFSLPENVDVEEVKAKVAEATETVAAIEEEVDAEIDNSFGSTDAQQDQESEAAIAAKAAGSGAAGSGVAGVIGGNGEDTEAGSGAAGSGVEVDDREGE